MPRSGKLQRNAPTRGTITWRNGFVNRLAIGWFTDYYRVLDRDPAESLIVLDE